MTQPTPTPTTQLDAVNVMLSTVGVGAVNSLEGSLPPQGAQALQILNEIDKEASSRGWHFNTEDNFTLQADVNSFIILPEDVIRASFVLRDYPNNDFTIRRNPANDELCLYDKKTHSFTMSGNVLARVSLFMPFEDTPESYRRYVTCRAARIFQDRTVGSQPHHAYNMRDEVEAERWLRKHEGTQKQRTVFDTYDAARPILRPYPRLRGF